MTQKLIFQVRGKIAKVQTGSKGSFRGELELCMDQHGLLLISNIATVSSTQSLYVTYLKIKKSRGKYCISAFKRAHRESKPRHNTKECQERVFYEIATRHLHSHYGAG